MAVKAVVMLTDFNLNGNDLYFKCKIEDASHSVSDIDLGPYDPATSDTSINADIKETVKQYAISNWGTSFGQLDKVRLVHLVDLLG